MHPMLNIAIRAVRKGGNIIIQNYDTQRFIKEDIEKNTMFIKNIMHKTYRIISEIIFKSYPNHLVVNKYESFLLKNNRKTTVWIVNALNGKKNFIKNFPHFCISITVITKKKIETSVIYDPIRNDLFTAVKGKGSQLNGYRTRCSNINTLKYATISTNLSNDTNQSSFSHFEIYKKLIFCGVAFRSTGSILLDLAYVASGRLDCVFAWNLNSINLIAGKLQIQESGCLVSDFKKENKENNFYSSTLISGPKFIRLITEKLREYSI